VAKEGPVHLGRKVVVIGGGNAAIDSARTAVRMGADVTVIYRRERKDMPAIREETDAAQHEGAKFQFLATPHRIVGDEAGNVKAIELVKTKLGEFDSSGRRRPVPTEEIIRIHCDTVILAVGEVVDPDFARASGLRIKEDGTLEVDRYTLETSRSQVLRGWRPDQRRIQRFQCDGLRQEGRSHHRQAPHGLRAMGKHWAPVHI
jgi:NADH-quinone oxidoreductase subunit F